jgi:hypothetical protein
MHPLNVLIRLLRDHCHSLVYQKKVAYSNEF